MKSASTAHCVASWWVSSHSSRAAAAPGSPEEREGLLAGLVHTEVYPLVLFAVGGMLLFPASNDLLTMFVALEVLSLPLYPGIREAQLDAVCTAVRDYATSRRAA